MGGPGSGRYPAGSGAGTKLPKGSSTYTHPTTGKRMQHVPGKEDKPIRGMTKMGRFIKNLGAGKIDKFGNKTSGPKGSGNSHAGRPGARGG